MVYPITDCPGLQCPSLDDKGTAEQNSSKTHNKRNTALDVTCAIAKKVTQAVGLFSNAILFNFCCVGAVSVAGGATTLGTAAAATLVVGAVAGASGSANSMSAIVKGENPATAFVQGALLPITAAANSITAAANNIAVVAAKNMKDASHVAIIQANTEKALGQLSIGLATALV